MRVTQDKGRYAESTEQLCETMSLWGHVMTVEKGGSSTPDPLHWINRGESAWAPESPWDWCQWMTDRGWSHWVKLMTGLTSCKISALHLLLIIKLFIKHKCSQRLPNWAASDFLSNKSQRWNDAPLSLPLKADRHFGGQRSHHPQPHGSLLVGCRPVLRDRLAFHPKKPCILAKIMRLSRALNSHRSVTQTEWFLADPACCDPALEDTVTVCASFFLSYREEHWWTEKFPTA